MINLKFLAVFMSLLVILTPVAFATEFSFDANGNIIHDGETFREYNSLNQLSAVYNGTDNSTLLAEYTYHPVEERVLVKDVYDSGVWEETIYYISDSFVSKKNSSGLYNETYVMLNGVKIVQVVDGEKQFIHSDHLGSSSVITNESGDVIERTSYDAYGLARTGASETRYDYESREVESFGTMDFRFRQYSPEYGIFYQPDTLIPNVYDPQSLNRYMFERGNPYKYTDPDGHVPHLIAIGIIFVVASYSGYQLAEFEIALRVSQGGDLTVGQNLLILGSLTSIVGIPSWLLKMKFTPGMFFDGLLDNVFQKIAKQISPQGGHEIPNTNDPNNLPRVSSQADEAEDTTKSSSGKSSGGNSFVSKGGGSSSGGGCGSTQSCEVTATPSDGCGVVQSCQ
jgi:RHS repeat-associated protein